MSTPNEFMAEAIALSLENVRNGGGPFGAVIVKDGKVIARGQNHVTATNDPTAHAEIVAIRVACSTLKSFQLTDCDIYSSCEPCPMCLAAIYWARAERVFFGNNRVDAAQIGFDDWIIYNEISLPFSERGIPMQQMMPDEAKVAFEVWKNLENKVEY
jgi:guanine deaminase